MYLYLLFPLQIVIVIHLYFKNSDNFVIISPIVHVILNTPQGKLIAVISPIIGNICTKDIKYNVDWLTRLFYNVRKKGTTSRFI